jgi:heme A synthase
MTKDTLFALSLFPYLGFLWFLTKSGQTPRLALWGFYILLVFVAVTIPAGIYTRLVLGQSLANVDPIHGGSEFFLSLSNIVVVIGFRQAIQQQKESKEPP